MVAVLGNCKQYQHSPEIIRLPQAHALLKALFSSRRNRVHSFFFLFFFFLLKSITWSELFLERIEMNHKAKTMRYD